MPNIGAVINSHNKKILEENKPLARENCNCRMKDECPMNGECTSTNVLYEAKINSNLRDYEQKVYKGITGLPFKTRFYNHKKSFNNFRYCNDSELSKEVWNIKNKGGDFSINWKLIKQCPVYNPANGRCALCTNEKLEIIQYKGDNLLNRRSEIVSTCRHRAKFMLKSYDVT